MKSINRMAVIIKPKQPFVDWINSMPDDIANYTLEQADEDNLTFLIPQYDDPDNAKKYIRNNYEMIFNFELWGWVTEEDFWPKNRNWEMFNDWFDVEINSEVFDLVDSEIEKEDL